MRLVIKGQVYSKSNQRKFAIIRGHPRVIKSKNSLDYEEIALWQLKLQLRDHVMFEKPCVLSATVWYPDRRQDLDISLILDILQKAGVYKNDRLVEEMHLYRKIDRVNPRAVIEVTEI